ncbi:MAG: hypothetical protein RSE62_03565 [Citrobacter sp.]
MKSLKIHVFAPLMALISNWWAVVLLENATRKNGRNIVITANVIRDSTDTMDYLTKEAVRLREQTAAAVAKRDASLQLIAKPGEESKEIPSNAPTMAPYDAATADWVAHIGQDMPVHEDTLLEADLGNKRFRCGKASELNWRLSGINRVQRYRPLDKARIEIINAAA